MKKYKDPIELIYDYVNKKINYDEYLKQLCILNVGEDNYDKYELYEHLYKLYVYTKDDKRGHIDNVFGEEKDSAVFPDGSPCGCSFRPHCGFPADVLYRCQCL